VTAEQRALVEALPEVTLVHSEVYAAAEAGGALDEKGRASSRCCTTPWI
jgi:hypothetical protein